MRIEVDSGGVESLAGQLHRQSREVAELASQLAQATGQALPGFPDGRSAGAFEHMGAQWQAQLFRVSNALDNIAGAAQAALGSMEEVDRQSMPPAGP
jgi:WXG100 family type VII secretion target